MVSRKAVFWYETDSGLRGGPCPGRAECCLRDFALEKALHASIRAGNTTQMSLTREYVRLQSKVQALTTMMAELCLLQGCRQRSSPGTSATQRVHDTLLTSLETTDPDVAARFDNRAISDFPEEYQYPPLFPPC